MVEVVQLESTKHKVQLCLVFPKLFNRKILNQVDFGTVVSEKNK